MVKMSKEFSIPRYFFEPIDVVTFCTHWWPQLHSKYRRPQVSSIKFMRFVWLIYSFLFRFHGCTCDAIDDGIFTYKLCILNKG